ncbi:hypothetical protein B0A50_07719 [Salinomyces thailandicus]|uniref:Pre-rRNA-processing protein n=1 Tax=Salinomyces thailandicus TaxID=706561 RepID=A0A4U0TLL8_9PEZI|nr:hypothetical protein B0A50_07719 [Salinomyces thailandica]
MGSSTKKKKEKAQDFQKAKLKVGKKRPTNTNATSTSFSAKSIVFQQQSVSSGPRDANSLFNHNLSLLTSKTETQRRDALQYLTTACLACIAGGDGLPQPASVVVAKAQPLILDGNAGVRSQLLKLLKVLPANEVGGLEQVLLYTRAGMTHLATDIRLFALEVLDWLLASQGVSVMFVPGAWVKTLRTFQNLLGWHNTGGGGGATQNPSATGDTGDKWTHTTASKTTSSGLSAGGTKLLVHQLNTLAHFLTVGLTSPARDPSASVRRTVELFPLWHTDAHLLPKTSNPYGYLNLFGAPRDAEGEVYEGAEDRVEVFRELGLLASFTEGVKEAKKEGGEVGRAGSGVLKALRLAGA